MHDLSDGPPPGEAYFITQCTYLRQFLAGEVVDGQMRLGPYGHIVREEWLRNVESAGSQARLDAYVVMPNHFHALVWIGSNGQVEQPAAVLDGLMTAFKAAVDRRVNDMRGTPDGRFWQPRYHSHRLRHAQAVPSVRRYVANNPADWERDNLNPAVGGQFCPIPMPDAG